MNPTQQKDVSTPVANPQDYFLDSPEPNTSVYKQQANSVYLKVKYYAVQAWPSISAALNSIFYTLFRIVREAVKAAIEQFKSS